MSCCEDERGGQGQHQADFDQGQIERSIRKEIIEHLFFRLYSWRSVEREGTCQAWEYIILHLGACGS